MAKSVFFSFHYQDVIDFRANVVRNHGVTKEKGEAGFLDSSIWESARKTNDQALKKLIGDEINGTTVSVVLIGTDTYLRPWVKYEIFLSLYRSNKTLGVHINEIPSKDGTTKAQGYNPFENIGLHFSDDGKSATPKEWNWSNKSWENYDKFASYSLASVNMNNAGKTIKISTWCPTYRWNTDDGFNNFKNWIL